METDKEEESLTIFPLPLWATVLIFVFCWPSIVFAEAKFSVENGGAVITLTDEPCQLEAVTNLPFKAVWVEDGKTFAGCWSPHRDARHVVAYFDDKTVALIPFGAVKALSGA